MARFNNFITTSRTFIDADNARIEYKLYTHAKKPEEDSLGPEYVQLSGRNLQYGYSYRTDKGAAYRQQTIYATAFGNAEVGSSTPLARDELIGVWVRKPNKFNNPEGLFDTTEEVRLVYRDTSVESVGQAPLKLGPRLVTEEDWELEDVAISCDKTAVLVTDNCLGQLVLYRVPEQCTSNDSISMSGAVEPQCWAGTACCLSPLSPSKEGGAGAASCYAAVGNEMMIEIFEVEASKEGGAEFIQKIYSENTVIGCAVTVCAFTPDVEVGATRGFLAFGTAEGDVGVVPAATWQYEIARRGPTIPTAKGAADCVKGCSFYRGGRKNSWQLLTCGESRGRGVVDLWDLDDKGALQHAHSIQLPEAVTSVTSCCVWQPEPGDAYLISCDTDDGRSVYALTKLVGIKHDDVAEVHHPYSLIHLSPEVDDAVVRQIDDMRSNVERVEQGLRNSLLRPTLSDGTVHLSNPADGFVLHHLEIYDDKRDDITCYGLSQDGRLLVAGHVSGLVSVWDIMSGHLLELSHEHDKPVTEVGLWTQQQAEEGPRELQQLPPQLVQHFRWSDDCYKSRKELDGSMMAIFHAGLYKHVLSLGKSERNAQMLLQDLQWHMAEGLLQEPRALQLVLEAAVRAGNVTLMTGTFQLFASKGWKALLGPLPFEELREEGRSPAHPGMSFNFHHGEASVTQVHSYCWLGVDRDE